MRPLLSGLFLALCLAVGAALAREAKRERQVCVPDASGSRWLCGPENDPPRPPPPPSAPTPAGRTQPAPSPPPFLAHPRLRREGLAPIAPPTSVPAESAARSAPSAAPNDLAPEARRAPAVASPPPSPAPAAPLAPETATASAPAPRPPREGESPRGGDFFALPPEAWAIQLAAGARDALRLPEGLPAERAHLVPMADAGHLLLLAPYPSVDEARSEAMRLSARLGRPVWPRRIGPLQNEARRAAVSEEPR